MIISMTRPPKIIKSLPFPAKIIITTLHKPGRMKLLIIGVGNPILRDDGVGIAAVRGLRQGRNRYLHSLSPDTEVVFKEASLGGLSLMEAMLGFDAVILLDAILSGKPPGTVQVLSPEDFNTALHASSPHDVSIAEGLKIGREYSDDLPENIIFITVEAEDITNFGEELTPEVERALPEVYAKLAGIAKEVERQFMQNKM